MRNFLYSSIFVLSFVAFSFSSCVEENVSFDENLELSFSCDTLVFDTLFSGQSSATRRFMIYNHNKHALSISSVRLGGGISSPFRFNVDGRIAGRGEELNDIIIKGKDSLFVFVEATPEVHEHESELAFFDSLVFSCNNRLKNVKLLSVGRDARLLRNYRVSSIEVFDSVRPYLVFGYIHVPVDCQLRITEGTEIFMHAGASIVVDGSIVSDGSFDAPVVIRGDRYDKINDVDQTPYDQTAGQWGSIYLQNPLSSHVFRNTHIRGSASGILLLGALRSYPSLSVANCVIHNSAAYGIYSQMGNVTLVNSEISNCGGSCLTVLGGNLVVAHTTFANYFRFATRDVPSVRIINHIYQNGRLVSFPVSSAVIENSIIFGNNAEELELLRDTVTTTDFNILVSHSLIKGKIVEDDARFLNCRWAMSRNVKNAKDTVFVNTSVKDIKKTGYFDFRLDSLSYARNCGAVSVSSLYPVDLDGISRLCDGAPDLGAYERVDK